MCSRFFLSKRLAIKNGLGRIMCFRILCAMVGSLEVGGIWYTVLITTKGNVEMGARGSIHQGCDGNCRYCNYTKLIISFVLQLPSMGCGSGCASVTEYKRGRAVGNQYGHTLSQEKARKNRVTNKYPLEGVQPVQRKREYL